jgi:beta-mannosidase
VHYFGEVDDFEDQCFLMQVNQARAIQTAIEYWRSRKGRCMGTLVWQLNDCWPVVSWSVIDFAGRKKLLWYAIRRAYRPQLLTIQPDGEKWTNGEALYLCAVNDADHPWKGGIVVRLVDFTSGTSKWESAFELSLGPRSSTQYRIDGLFTAPTREVIVADLDGSRATWFALEDRHLEYPKVDVTDGIAMGRGLWSPTHFHLQIEAQTFVRDLCVMADKLDAKAEASTQLVTCLPFEVALFGISKLSKNWDTRGLGKNRLIRSVNPFGAMRYPSTDDVRPPPRMEW